MANGSTYDEIMTTEEAAQWLRVSERKVRYLKADGLLKAFYVGRSVRFRLRDLEDYVERFSSKPFFSSKGRGRRR